MKYLYVLTLFLGLYANGQQIGMDIIQDADSDKYGLNINGKSIIPEKYDSLAVERNFVVGLTHKSWDIYTLQGKLLKSGVKAFYPYLSKMLQILDAHHNVYFIDDNGNTIIPTKNATNISFPNDELGNSTYVSYKITRKRRIEEDILSYSRDSSYSYHFKIDPPEGAIFRRLMNNKRKISFERGWPKGGRWGELDSDFVLVKGNGKHGLWSLNTREYVLPLEYDGIKHFISYLYLKKNGLMTFYPNIGKKPKYKKLTPYQDFFARFETPDDKKGWVDRKGKEYFDQ